MALCLGLALGASWCLAIFSILYFLFLEIGSGAGFPYFECFLVTAFLVAVFLTLKRSGMLSLREKGDKNLELSLRVALAAVLVSFAFFSAWRPHGFVDAWAQWNMRARFIDRLGAQWKDAFSPLVTHADYPLMLPLSVALIWKILGSETVLAPMIVAAVFSLGTVALLTSTVALQRGKNQGLLAGLALLGYRAFIRHAPDQYADIPLSFFILSALALAAFHERSPQKNGRLLLLCGLAAGFAAWTKNEGQLFSLAIAAALFSTALSARGFKTALRDFFVFACGLAAPLAVVFFFKRTLAPPSDLYNAQAASSIPDRLMDISRYLLLAKDWLRIALTSGGVLGLPTVLIYFLIAEKDTGQNRPAVSAVVGRALGLTLIGYFFALVTSQLDLKPNSQFPPTDRLFLQLWPGFLLWIFLKTRSFAPHEAGEIEDLESD